MYYICGMALIEAVPNVSEGRHPGIIQILANSITNSPGVHLLDASSDIAHNRTVFTIVGEKNPLKMSLLNLYAAAVELIDLRSHTGEHPRIGAVDVVPLVPLAPRDVLICLSIASELGKAISERFDIPVYLYENSARAPERRRLEKIRSGGFEGLTEKMKTKAWHPDFGRPRPHPSLGASVVGVRRLLIAYNVNLETGNLDMARHIAYTVRASDGGLKGVKAIGVRTNRADVVQVSINLVDYEKTSLYLLFEWVKREASSLGVGILNSEIVGMVPASALFPGANRRLQLTGFTVDQILEYRLPHLHTQPPG